MSLMAMKQVFKKYGVVIVGFLALTFIVTGFIGFGNNLGGSNRQQVEAEKPIARVGDREITANEVDRVLSRITAGVAPADMMMMRLSMLEQYKTQEAVVEAAKKAGITVTDADIQKMRDQRWAQERTGYIGGLGLGEKATDRDIDRALERNGESIRVAQLKEAYPESDLRTQVYAEKLQEKFKQEARAQATEEAVRDSYKEIQVRHILVKFGEGALPEEQARAKAQKLLDAIKKDPSRFAALAKENSDDTGSKEKGGFLDWASPRTYVKSFTKAALSLKPGQLYPELVRESNPGYSGFHIIKLEGIRVGKDFPKDFDKEKQKYIDQYVEQQAQQAAQQAMMEATAAVKVEVLDPMLRAAQLQQEAYDPTQREAKLNAALKELDKVTKAEDHSGVVPMMRARIYESLNKPNEAIEAYQEALKYRNSLETRIALAQLYQQTKQKPQAVEQLAAAEKLVRSEIDQLQTIARMYKSLGEPARAAAAGQKAAELQKRKAEMAPQGMPQGMPQGVPVGP